MASISRMAKYGDRAMKSLSETSNTFEEHETNNKRSL